MKDTKELAELRRFAGEHMRTAENAIEAMGQIMSRLSDALEAEAKFAETPIPPWVEYNEVVGVTPGGVPVVALHPGALGIVTEGSHVRVRIIALDAEKEG